MSRKFLAIFTLFIILFSFAACNNVDGGEGNGVIPASTKIANEFAKRLKMCKVKEVDAKQGVESFFGHC